MKKGSQDEFFSLLMDALADASKNCQEKGPIVFNGQRPNEANYGISPQNPLCSTSLGGTDAYLRRLRTLDGKKFTWSRGETIYVDCNGAKEVGMDKYQLYLGDKPYKVLYFVPYVGESTEAPHGMRLVDGGKGNSVPEAPLNTESASTAAKAPLKVKVKARVVPKTNEPPVQTSQKVDDKKDGTPLEISEQDAIVENTHDIVSQEDNIPHNLPVIDEDKPAKADSKTRRKWKPILFSALGVVLVAALTLLAIFLLPKKVIEQDINTINGCPEFYNVEFGMTVDEASRLIELKHKTIKGFESSVSGVEISRDSAIVFLDDVPFNLYGIKTADYYVSFEGNSLDGVLFSFDKEDVSLNKLIKLYSRLYGPATTERSASATWEGPKTTIDIYDHELLVDAEDKTIIVRYNITENSQFTTLSFDGPELDPCDFLGSNYIFSKEPTYYTSSLKKDEDYSYQKYSPEGFPGFEQYTLYPRFSYMGISKGSTAIEFNVGADTTTINSVSYLFLLDQDNAVDRMDYIEKAIVEEYGTYNSCTYTSTKYSELGIVDISFDEFKQKVGSGTQGIYHVQWISNGKTITLGLTISVDRTYYDGSVAFSIQDEHKHEYTLKSELAPTCETDGKKEYACSCGDSYSETVNATGHSYSGGTCTQVATCSICKKTDTAPGHTLVDCVCTKCKAIVLTSADLQGTWKATWNNDVVDAYDIVKFSGNSYYREHYFESAEYGYTDFIIMTGTYTVSGNVLTIRATATNTRTTESGSETHSYSYNHDDVIEEYTPSQLVISVLAPHYKQ